MVALRGKEIDAFLARPDSGRPIILLYGPDAGLVRERADALMASAVDDPNDPFSLVRLDGDLTRRGFKPDIVKIDVEGFDMEVVKGGQAVLERAAAAIIEIALPESPKAGPTFLDFVQTMSDLGFMYRGNLACAYVEGTIRLVDAVFIKPPALRQVAAQITPSPAAVTSAMLVGAR